jgi:hypothetical protein
VIVAMTKDRDHLQDPPCDSEHGDKLATLPVKFYGRNG